MDSLTALFFLVGSLGIVTIATLAYVTSGYRPEMRFALVASLLLIAALFAFSPFMFIARNPEAWAEAQQRQTVDP